MLFKPRILNAIESKQRPTNNQRFTRGGSTEIVEFMKNTVKEGKRNRFPPLLYFM